jgi:hypothetical protein
MAIPKVTPFPFEIHICPACEADIASGADIDGEPTLCRQCEALNKLRTARVRILHARQQKRISGKKLRLAKGDDK